MTYFTIDVRLFEEYSVEVFHIIVFKVFDFTPGGNQSLLYRKVDPFVTIENIESIICLDIS